MQDGWGGGLTHMRYWRLIAGLFLILVFLWVVLGEQLSGASADATINAELMTVRAPIAGQLALRAAPLGLPVGAGEELGAINDPLIDTVRRDDLEMEQFFAASEVERLQGVAAALADQQQDYEARLEDYGMRRLSELQARLRHARARLELLESGEEPDVVAATLDRGQSGNPGDALLPGVALEYAREQVATLEIALAAARDGIFLGDGYNDAPFAGQRLAEIELRAATTRAELAEVEARLEAISTRLSDERLRTNRLGTAVLRSSVPGHLWERLAADGETVQRGQDLLKLLDCRSTIVTLSVTENVYNRLEIGTEARFRPAGSDRVLPGTVIRLAGAGAATLYRNLAVAPGEKHLERYDVALLVPALREEPELYCQVGRTGRVFFDARPLDALREIFG